MPLSIPPAGAAGEQCAHRQHFSAGLLGPAHSHKQGLHPRASPLTQAAAMVVLRSTNIKFHVKGTPDFYLPAFFLLLILSVIINLPF